MELKIGGIYRIYRPEQRCYIRNNRIEGFDVIFKVIKKDSSGYHGIIISCNGCLYSSSNVYFLYSQIEKDYINKCLYDLN